jgi:hypothetical protein
MLLELTETMSGGSAEHRPYRPLLQVRECSGQSNIGKQTGTMATRLVQIQAFWNRSLERLRVEWVEFPDGMFLATAEEEMKTRREELESHDRTDSPLCAPHELQHIGGD